MTLSSVDRITTLSMIVSQLVFDFYTTSTLILLLQAVTEVNAAMTSLLWNPTLSMPYWWWLPIQPLMIQSVLLTSLCWDQGILSSSLVQKMPRKVKNTKYIML